MAGVIHVGAWDGREYVGTPGPLVLVEPQAGPFNVMRQHLKDRPDVELHQVACGANAGTATLHVAYPDHSSSLLRPKVSERFGGAIQFTGKREIVDVVTLDSIVRGRTDLATLRIDAQGYELEVLKGAADTLFRVSRVEVEVHDPAIYAGAAELEQISRLVGAAGFELVKFDELGSDDLADVVYERTEPTQNGN